MGSGPEQNAGQAVDYTGTGRREMESSGIFRGTGLGWLVATALVFAGLVFSAPVEGAIPPGFWTKCPTGSGAGQCMIPRGLAVADEASPNRGNLYVADQENSRIDEFTAWGEFVKAWGWDVVDTGPGDDTTVPEDEFEICVPSNGDVCKAGVQGGGRGQLGRPQGIAVDSNGDLYVAEGDFGSRRVQKFDLSAGPSEEEVQFVWMVGGKVNKTKVEEGAPASEQNLCPVAPGDVCQAAAEGTGSSEFGAFVAGSYISIDPTSNTIDVGDQERIQVFEPDGTYVKSIAIPGERVQSLAIDSGGNLYVSYLNIGKTNIALAKPNVHKLNSSGSSICTIEAKNPTAVTIAPSGRVYLVDGAIFGESRPPEIRQFDSTCADKLEPFAMGEFTDSTGIATGFACNNGVSVYVSNAVLIDSFVKAYGARPDPAVCPPPVKPPDITAQYAASVGSDSAVLRAQINPHFWEDTAYYVEYGTAKCTESVCAKQPPGSGPGVTLKGAGVDEDVTSGGIVLNGLQPNTTYHFRFVAQSSGGGPTVGEEGTFTTFPLPNASKADCPNQPFRVGASALLPDCRVYEMVSPIDKNNGDIEVLGRYTTPNYPAGFDQSSTDGDKLTYSSATAFGGAISAPNTSQYIASRVAGQAWSTHAINPSRNSESFVIQLKVDNQYKTFSADLCSGWLTQDALPLLSVSGGVPDNVNLYRRDNCGEGVDAYEVITGNEISEPPTVDFRPELQGVSADGIHAVFRAGGQLTEDAASTDFRQLYASSGGALHYVCVLPDGTPSGLPCTAGTVVNSLTLDRENTVARALSEDGSRLFWSLPASGSAGPGRLYLRVNPDQEPTESGECSESEPDKACTVLVSGSAATRFWTAATDGSKAIYTVGDIESGATLLKYDVEGAEVKSIAEGVVGVAGASDNASHIYFTSKKVLDGEAKEGQPNLYLYRVGGEGETELRFIGTLAGADVGSRQYTLLPLSSNPMQRSSRISPDGSSFAFTSTASLTGYDNTDLESGEPDAEVFLYDADTDQLACISCNPSGARPVGRELEIDGQSAVMDEKGPGFWVAAQIPVWEDQLYASRPLSSDGRRVFFETTDALVTRDTNGTQDVYEWLRASGEKECQEAGAELFVTSAGGCLSLVSSGESPVDSKFVDASPDGRDVFFKTASSLLPQDPGLIDIYDARENGGLPGPSAPQPPCEGEACQSPPVPPDDPTPASNSFEGLGNPPVESVKQSCPKGKRKVRRNGKARCVPKHKRRHKKSNSPHHGRAAR